MQIKKEAKVLMRIFYIILAVCPFALGVIFAVFNLTVGWDRLGIEGRDNLFYSLTGFNHPFVGILCFLILVAFGFGAFFLGKFLIFHENKNSDPGIVTNQDRNIIRKRSSKSLLTAACYVFAITVLLRLILLFIYGDSIEPFSDFANTWLNAKGDDYLLGHYKFFPAYLNYAVFERILTHFNRKYIIVIISSIVLNGFSAVGIYLLAGEISEAAMTEAMTKKVNFAKNVPLAAALLFAFDPSSILYALIGNPEHVTVCCNIFAIWLIIKSGKKLLFKSEWKKVKNWVMILIAGVLCGIGNSMKSFFPIMAVALVLTGIMYFVISGKLEKKKLITSLISVIVLAAILFAGEYVTNKAILKFTEKVFNIEACGSDALPHFIMVGLSYGGEGQVNLGEHSRYYITMRENGVSHDEAFNEALEVFKSDWAGHESEIPLFLLKKCIWEWQDDDRPHFFFCYAMGLDKYDGEEYGETIQGNVYQFIEEYGSYIGELYYLMLMLGGLAASVLLVINGGDILKMSGADCTDGNSYPEYSDAINSGAVGLLLSNLLIEGFFCLTLLSEAQSRYKHLIIPFICILAAVTLTCFWKKNKKIS